MITINRKTMLNNLTAQLSSYKDINTVSETIDDYIEYILSTIKTDRVLVDDYSLASSSFTCDSDNDIAIISSIQSYWDWLEVHINK